MDAVSMPSPGDVLVSPPVVFLVSLMLAGLLSLAGRLLTGPSHASPRSSETYASGEAGPRRPAAPGYEPFFATAIFFTILHLGVLVVATGAPSPLAILYLGGLGLALAVLLS
jgi:hypothetical protein